MTNPSVVSNAAAIQEMSANKFPSSAHGSADAFMMASDTERHQENCELAATQHLYLEPSDTPGFEFDNLLRSVAPLGGAGCFWERVEVATSC